MFLLEYCIDTDAAHKEAVSVIVRTAYLSRKGKVNSFIRLPILEENDSLSSFTPLSVSFNGKVEWCHQDR